MFFRKNWVKSPPLPLIWPLPCSIINWYMKHFRSVLSILTIVVLGLLWKPTCFAMKQKKLNCLETLNTLQKKHFAELASLDQQIRQIVSQSQSLKFAQSSNREVRIQFDSWDKSLANLVDRRKELSLRRDFVDRLIFQIESKWNSNDLRGFLTKQLMEMAFTEIAESRSQSASQLSNMWRFLSYLSIALREIPDPNENLLAFIESYMNFSSILNPKPPFSFLEHRHYTSGPISTQAKSVKLEELGLTLEKRKIELLQKIQPTGELRTELTDQTNTPPVEETVNPLAKTSETNNEAEEPQANTPPG